MLSLISQNWASLASGIPEQIKEIGFILLRPSSLLGLKDGDHAGRGHGHLDIVDLTVSHCCEVEKNLQELYRRVAFNILLGNSGVISATMASFLTARGGSFPLPTT